MFDINLVIRSYWNIIILLVIFSLTEVSLSITSPESASLISSSSIIVASFFAPSLAICFDMMSSILQIGGGPMGFIAQLLVIFSCLRLLYSNWESLPKYTIYINIYFLFVLAISYYKGFNSNATSAIYVILGILRLLAITSIMTTKDRYRIVAALLISAFSMTVFIGYAVITGDNSVFNAGDSLSFMENAKALSTTIVPLCYAAIWYIISPFTKKNVLTISVSIFLAMSVLFLIILTYSRGVLIALISGITFVIFKQIKISSFKSIISIIIVVVAVSYLVLNMKIDSYRVFGNLEGGNGRDEIWLSFWQQMKDTNSVIFGFGPGSVKEISRTGYYAHSVILDYLFCYGILGLFYILFLLTKCSKELFKERSKFYLGLLIISCIMFFAHGVVGNPMFILITGICIGTTSLTLPQNRLNI